MIPKNIQSPTILLVDDHLQELTALIAFLETYDFRVAVARNGQEALKQTGDVLPDLILLDVLMPGMDGFETCRHLKEHEGTKDIPVIFMTALTDTVDKVRGFELGGVDYITKPVQHEEVLARINAHLSIRRLQQQLQAQNARLQEKNAQLQVEIAIRKQTEEALKTSKEEQNHLRKEVATLQTTLRDRYKFGDIIGKSQVMQEVYEQIVKAAATEANVVISGESGTGKELVARTIHQMSDRKGQAFVAVNCGAVTESIFEREFFGHRRGAFTGADRDKPGYFDQANGGTLFLDEVGELTPNFQAKLLRALDAKEYIPVGDTISKRVDVRIIAATNKDLKALLQQGSIREDFYYRIRVIVITLPSLRDRREDIPLLVEYFLKQYDPDNKRPPISGKIMDALCAYHWPGNVRELQNELQRYLAEQHLEFIGNDLGEQDEGPDLEVVQKGLSFREAVEVYEKRLIARTLAQNNWRQGKTAKILNISVKTLYNKMKKYGLKP